jgi:chromosome segregation ATPase
MPDRRIASWVAMAVMVAAAGVTQAQTARQGGGGNNAAMLAQLQQLASERTALQSENAKLKGDLEKLRKERDSASAARDAAENRIRATAATATRGNAEAERLQAELERERGRMQELVTRSREIAINLRDVEVDRNQVRQTLASREAELKSSVERNDKLLALNREILDAMENRGVWSTLAASEPFTRIKRNQLENLVDGYRQQAQDQRADAPQVQPKPAATAPAR